MKHEKHEKHDNLYYLSRAPILRALAHLCIPMMAALSVGVVYNIINAGFIGSLDSTPMLAALTFGLPILTVVMAIGGVFGTGGGAAISRLLGLADAEPGAHDQARRVGAFVTYGSIAVGAVVAAVGLVLLGPLVSALGTDPASTAATTRYVAGMLCFTPVMVATFAVDQLVRAEGAARASSLGMIASTVANFAFDVLFILVLHLDVLGAALGMGLANLLTLGYYLWWLRRHSVVLSISPRWFTLESRVVRPVLSVGASELLMSSFMLVSTLMLNHVAVRYGDAPLAAFGVAQRIVQFPEVLAMGVFMGVLPLVAYAYGAGDHARVRAGLRASVLAIGGIIALFSTSVFLFRHQLFGSFSSSEEVVRLGTLVLAAMVVSTVFNGFTGLMMTWFQASEQAARAAIVGTMQGGLFVPVILVMNAAFGLDGIVWSMAVAEVICFVAALGLVATGRRTDAEPSEIAAANALALAAEPA